jgi:hypothetical protein
MKRLTASERKCFTRITDRARRAAYCMVTWPGGSRAEGHRNALQIFDLHRDMHYYQNLIA